MEIKDRIRYETVQGMSHWLIDITDIVMSLCEDDSLAGIIEKIGITQPSYLSEDEVIEIAQEYIKEQIENVKEDSEITFDSEAMIIIFKNGKRMSIYNSEFGGISMYNTQY